MGFEEEVAGAGLDISAIKLNPDDPFLWASGFHMPIYNDNRMFLFHPKHRRLIAEGFRRILGDGGIQYDVIAGTSTAGISPATTLADCAGMPLIYVRDKPKDHGLRNQIEGIDANSDLQGRRVVLVEDLISTGGSSVKAVQAIRSANGLCDNCLTVFDYELDVSAQAFGGLNPPCQVNALLRYSILLKVARDRGYINEIQARGLEEWRADPFGWGEKHGFPKVER
ncbi:MAG: orotate phosphoribosyltransferase [Nanoarchaeota archaeon]|nr:orotate phosphoribosyltransferase [Nanoarchaeota archaeon]MBU0977626.1 orotate phosphoribosyltransferase [Nanoarchaeota archaeon]